MGNSRERRWVATLVLPLVAACAGSDAAPGDADSMTIASAPAEITVRTRDYHFDMPDTIEAGLTNIRLINDGPEPHHVQLVRMDEGHRLDELLEAFATHGPPPAWAVQVGGPNTPGVPGGETSALVDLRPGAYAVLCVIPSPDGTLHVMKGMVRELTVVPAARASAALPPADIVMTLDDYSFATDMPLSAGRHTIRVENRAAQHHEVVFVRLAPGRTAADFVNWVANMQGPPPGELLGGTTGFDAGQVNQITLDLTPGEYALLCFLPDLDDGRSHVAHGMMQQVTIE